MSKKFAEHSQLNLSQVNKDVLKKWDLAVRFGVLLIVIDEFLRQKN
jgi:hypothetical protein